MNAIRIYKVVVVTVLLGMASMSSAAEGTWTKKADMPTRRLCHSTSVVDGKIYAIGGGYSIDGPPLRTVEEYDPVTDTWTKKRDIPTARFTHSASVANGKIYVIGGAVQKAVSCATVEEYDPATDTWTTKADMPTKRAFLCACTVDGQIYAFGGGYSPGPEWNPSVVEVYDPATDTWTQKADMPTARSLAAASVVDGKIYAIGGVVGDIAGSAISIMEEYEPMTDTWARKANMPTGRKALSACVVSGRVYAIGGATGRGPAYSTVEEYDPTTDTWTRKPDMPTARWFPASDEVNGKIYAIGGGVNTGVAISTVEEYDPSPLVVDFNGDGIVDIEDLLQLIESWRQADPSLDIGPRPFGDGIVDEKDLEVLMSHWGEEPGLIAKWKLDEAEGMIAADSAGEHDATVVGIPAWQPAGGMVGGALELDGTTFVTADSVLSPAEGPFSVLAWIKGGAPGQVLISQVDGASWLMADPSGGTLMTELSPPAGRKAIPPLVSETVITDGDWHRVAFVWDAVTRALYVDDALVAEDAQSGLASCSGGLNFGCDKAMTPGTSWNGLIDEVRLYNRALRP